MALPKARLCTGKVSNCESGPAMTPQRHASCGWGKAAISPLHRASRLATILCKAKLNPIFCNFCWASKAGRLAPLVNTITFLPADCRYFTAAGALFIAVWPTLSTPKASSKNTSKCCATSARPLTHMLVCGKAALGRVCRIDS